MSFAVRLDQLHYHLRRNRWLGYFAVFNRIALAAGFLPSGLQKVLGERFTALSNEHPMGSYLEAIYHTGYYYTFVGVLQVTAAIFLLIPRTATLGAIIYFPIILNICILSLAVRFDGSLISSPLMVLANLYLLCWDYHKLKLILPFNSNRAKMALPKKEERSSRFPTLFFAGVMAAVLLVGVAVTQFYDILPRNSISECMTQCEGVKNPEACADFCDCIHNQGRSLDQCLDQYNDVSTGH